MWASMFSSSTGDLRNNATTNLFKDILRLIRDLCALAYDLHLSPAFNLVSLIIDYAIDKITPSSPVVAP